MKTLLARLLGLPRVKVILRDGEGHLLLEKEEYVVFRVTAFGLQAGFLHNTVKFYITGKMDIRRVEIILGATRLLSERFEVILHGGDTAIVNLDSPAGFIR